MKKIYSFTLLLASLASFAQATDDFTGAESSTLVDNGWAHHSGATTGQLITIGGNLAYAGISNGGNSTMIVAGNGEDVNRPVGNLSGTVYYSLILQLNNADGLNLNSTTGDYFLSLGTAAGANVTGLPARLYVKAGSVAGTYNLGVLNNSGGIATPTYATQDLTTANVFVVVKYDLGTNTASLFINPAIGGAEGTAAATNTTGTTAAPTQILSVAIRQGGNATAGTGNFILDTIRVGSTWSFVTGGTLGVADKNIAGLKLYPNPVTGGTLNVQTDLNDTKEVAIFDILGKQVVKATTESAVNVSSLKTGVYVVKITEAGKTATRKLVIK
ncbi:MAG: T9SS type A sorting domain-containing protein [Flavobacterium sp.]|uniref:T9SS type A sorting domain-containing protein n=1 Tax=Flavobacterium sp. TaxID=239 RepID=UPI0011FDC9D8|nr:T9SS type A sorting domain-containing protein [Flavobacterium sp.]RZJ68612.1 MAG: T9SS type A sorting domain-containing protein [Flavobacterium sp.]